MRVASHHCSAVVVQLVVIVCDETCDIPVGVVAALIRPAVDLMQSGYVEPQVHPFDRFFYNRSSHSYTVERFLDDLNDRYGGVDSILLWPTYPMIGADDRNQFDMIRAMPGGVQRLKALGDELHKRGVRSLWPYNPWDYGTHHNHSMSGRSFFTYSLADLVSETDFDGFFGDTMASFALLSKPMSLVLLSVACCS